MTKNKKVKGNPNAIRAKEKAAVIIQASGWAFMLFALVLYLLFWRVDNEPGAMKAPELLRASLVFLATGGLAFLGANGYLITQKAWKPYRVAWLLCAVIFILAVLCSPLVLILLV